MSVRKRVQIAITTALVAVLATSLASMAITPAAQAAGSSAGSKAGRAAGATAGASAGRTAGAKVGGGLGAAAGEKAGRAAGAAAGAKAGQKKTVKAATKAGRVAGAKAGAKAGTAAGKRAALAAGPNCGTGKVLKPNGVPWKCTFSDDFDGTSLNASKWRVMTSADFNFGKRSDCFENSPANVSVGGGVLTLTARREKASFKCQRGRSTFRTSYTAGMVSTYDKYIQAYGRFEFRAKFPYSPVRGLQTSAWLWPDGANGSQWPASGEIDVAEWYSQWPDLVIPYLHYGSSAIAASQATNNKCSVDNVADWHTYVLEWTPKSITISYDGTVCLVNTSNPGAPFNKPYMMAMFNGFGLKRNAPTAATPGTNRAQFAWVRAWS